MNRKDLVILAIAGAAFAGVFAMVQDPLITPARFILYLRCSNSKSGVLTVAQGTGNSTARDIAQVDLVAACNAGKVEIAGYEPENRLYFTLRGIYAKQPEATAEYGRDIQSDNDGFYCVLNVNSKPPYLTNDRI